MQVVLPDSHQTLEKSVDRHWYLGSPWVLGVLYVRQMPEILPHRTFKNHQDLHANSSFLYGRREPIVASCAAAQPAPSPKVLPRNLHQTNTPCNICNPPISEFNLVPQKNKSAIDYRPLPNAGHHTHTKQKSGRNPLL